MQDVTRPFVRLRHRIAAIYFEWSGFRSVPLYTIRFRNGSSVLRIRDP
jgi:hypothetical protein